MYAIHAPSLIRVHGQPPLCIVSKHHPGYSQAVGQRSEARRRKISRTVLVACYTAYEIISTGWDRPQSGLFQGLDEKFIKTSPLSRVYTEVWLSAYYQNYLHLPQEAPGLFALIYPVDPDTKMPFTSVQDLGRLVLKIAHDPSPFQSKTISLVSEFTTPVDQLRAWEKGEFWLPDSVPITRGVQTRFESLSLQDFQRRLEKVHGFDPKFALTMAENMAIYQDNPNMWVDGSGIKMSDIFSDLVTWETY
ncbi:hypothetical protein BGW36DRAFT_407202 [Talaromyces proteolyticus]|uniref:NmrA-like domain-containing protein n=1 Tax=Talaromyces proteolyticus TaxID=1131652 RepID=A0AAD4KQH8_9EURO|nr:uncharacterized protein BGW36DRAFT_407202 [Talaromyces proteolyticus]KAH8697115.1 hypothetical protein BGW36DRAFT_407202 [Talaromyces proteolyticus]